MTGKYPVRTGITNYTGAPQQQSRKRNTQLLPANYTDRLPLEEITIAEALKDGGYNTFLAGKWHLGPEGYWPEGQSFMINKGGVDKGNPGKGYFSPYNNPRLSDGPEGEYLPERLAEETVSYIKSSKGSARPFFIFHSFYLVHTPYLAKKDLVAKYRAKRDSLQLNDEMKILGRDVYDPSKYRQVRVSQSFPEYAAMVDALDQAVGRIVQALKDEGLYENTLIVFTSDNGGLSTSEGWATSNEPLKAGKGWPYEGGIREPLLVRWPGVTQPGTESNEVVNSTDWYPTLLEAAGLPLRPRQHIDGISLIPVLKGGKAPSRRLFWHYPHYGNQGGAPFSSVMDGDLKLIKFYENVGYYELYNVRDDIGETKNLLSAYPDKAKELKKALETFLLETNARLPVSNPAHFSTH